MKKPEGIILIRNESTRPDPREASGGQLSKIIFFNVLGLFEEKKLRNILSLQIGFSTELLLTYLCISSCSPVKKVRG